MDYNSSSDLLEELKIKEISLTKITDENEISDLEEKLYNGKDLPIDIVKKPVSLKPLSDQVKYENVEALPEFIERKKDYIKVTQYEEVKKIENYMKNHDGDTPKGIRKNIIYDSDMNSSYRYFYDKDIEYYQVTYDFFKRRPFTDKEMEFRLNAINTKSLKSISSSLTFFQNLAIGLVIINIILLFFFIIANS